MAKANDLKLSSIFSNKHVFDSIYLNDKRTVQSNVLSADWRIRGKDIHHTNQDYRSYIMSYMSGILII